MKGIAKAWPPDRFPNLRASLKRRERALQDFRKTLRFKLWSWTSGAVYGETRPVTLFTGKRLTVRTDDYRAFSVNLQGGTQRRQIALWQTMARLGPDVAVDVGANYGEFTSAVADMGALILAVEPNGAVFDCLAATFRGHPRVRLAHVAASDAEGSGALYSHPVQTGGGALTEQLAVPKLDARLAAPRVRVDFVQTRRLADLIPEMLGRSPESAILKVDVEGTEDAVIEGALPLLQECRWWLALVEFNPDAIRRAHRDPDRVWARYKGFSGRALPDPASSVTFDMSCRLQDAAPQVSCDIIFGAGLAGSLLI